MFASTLVGLVKDAITGQPVPGATVNVEVQGDCSVLPDGSYINTFMAGTYDITYTSPDHYTFVIDDLYFGSGVVINKEVFLIPKVATPQLSGPSGNMPASTPDFTWYAQDQITWQKIELVQNGNVIMSKWITEAQASSHGYPNQNLRVFDSATVGLNLAAGGYKWRVKAYNGHIGEWSNYMHFTKM